MKGRKMYTVRGSHDGILGVYSNKKKAWEAVKNYLKEYDNLTCTHSETYKSIKGNYSNFCKHFSFMMEIGVENNYDTYCDVQLFELNRI